MTVGLKSLMVEPPLVGREHELEELTRFLDCALKGNGKTIFVSGEAGCGKTRLTNEFLRLAKEKDATVLSGWCVSDVAVPYFPFMEAFNSYYSTEALEKKEPERSESEAAEIKAWLAGPRPAEKGRKFQDLSPQAWQDLTLAAVTNTLRSISARKPAVLFLDDIHWADSASLSVLHYISRALHTARVLVLATFRSEELNPDEEGHPHPLVETLRLMKREDLFTEIRLANLSQTHVSKVAENMMGGTVHPDLAAKLAAESRGNPLFIVESLRMLSERGGLYQKEDLWHLSVDVMGIPEKLKDIILRRLGLLKFNHRRVLDAASVIGEKFDVELLGTVLGQDSLEVLETLNVVAQSTSLVRVEENCFRFDHAKSREAIYEEIPLPLKRGYHARVAERLEAKSEPLPLSDIAYHFAQSGNKEKALEYSLASGEDALARFSNLEAIRHFSYVLQNLRDFPENLEKKRIALEGLGDAYYVNGSFTKAVEMFERAAEASAGKAKLRAFRKAMDAIFFGTKDRVRLLELAGKAEPYAASDRLESARIRFHKAGALDSIKARGEEFEAALQVFEEEYSLPDVARALEGVGSAEILCSEQKEVSLSGVSKSLLAIAMFEELGDLRGVVRSASVASGSLVMFGLMQEGWALYAKVIQIGEKIGDYKRMAHASLSWGRQLETFAGRFDEALSLTLKSAEYFEKTDEKYPQEWIHAGLLRQYARLGNLEAAGEYYKQLASWLPDNRSTLNQDYNIMEMVTDGLSPRGYIRLVREVARSLAFFSAVMGRWEEANKYFEQSSALTEKVGWRLVEAGDHTDRVWALERQGKMNEAKMHRKEVQKYFDETEERLSRVKLEVSLIASQQAVVGEEFEMRLDIVNVSRKSAQLVRVADLVPLELDITSLPLVKYSLNHGLLDMKNETIGPFRVETVKLRLRASKPGNLIVAPRITYINEKGETKTCEPKPITITVQPARPKYEVLPGRVSTGFEDLDALLLGGIPQNYAVALASPSTEERELIVHRFLEAGAILGEVTFHVTGEAANTKALAAAHPSNFFLFLCNPQAEDLVENASNVFKLKGVENLTEIDIALIKAFRLQNPSAATPRRICIEVVSDVLLQHHAVTTRRWLSALLPTLKTRGFTILAVVDQGMHSSEELQAILGLFEGEIKVVEKETAQGAKQVLRVRRLHKQRFMDDELVLSRERLEQ